MLSKVLLAIFSAAIAFAGSSAIGIATASGHFSVESAEVWGNSTLFDGSTVETAKASSELALRGGIKVQLGASSKARVWSNRVLLEKGVGQVSAPASYEIDAAGLKIQGARVRVGVTDRVQVESLGGAARVTNQSGFLLASIPAGRAMSFSAQAGASGVITRTGCLLYKDGHFILQDENTQEVAELTGRDLAANTGNRVEVTGSVTGAQPAVSIATVVLDVATVTTKSQGGCLSVASALDAQTEAPASAANGGANPANPANPSPASTPTSSGGGLSKGAKTAIILGIAGGAGAGAALALAGKKSSTSP